MEKYFSKVGECFHKPSHRTRKSCHSCRKKKKTTTGTTWTTRCRLRSLAVIAEASRSTRYGRERCEDCYPWSQTYKEISFRSSRGGFYFVIRPYNWFSAVLMIVFDNCWQKSNYCFGRLRQKSQGTDCALYRGCIFFVRSVERLGA